MAADVPLRLGASLHAIRQGIAPPRAAHPDTPFAFAYHYKGHLLDVRSRYWQITLAPCSSGVTGFDYSLLWRFWFHNPHLFRRQGRLTNLGETLVALQSRGAIERRDSHPFTNLLFATPLLRSTVSQCRSF